MARVWLSIGSNKDDKLFNLQKAYGLINLKAGKILASSAYYETEPWGYQSCNYFYNRVLLIETVRTPENLLQTLRNIENIIGRERSEDYIDRTIDIDILFYDDVIIDTNELVIPHAKLHERKFVLVPMQELAPEFVHPLFGQTINQLLEVCTDTMEVAELVSLSN